MSGKPCVRSSAGESGTLTVAAPFSTALPRWTEMPAKNSTTYHLMPTSPAVPKRWNVSVVPFVIWPLTSPSRGLGGFTSTLKTRNALVVSTDVMVTVCVVEPFASVVVPDWTFFSCAGGVRVGDGVGVAVRVGVSVGVGVRVTVAVDVTVGVGVGVTVFVAVTVGVGV